MSSWLVDYPFADRLYPGALEAVKHVQQWGTAVILSDGDAVFQPRKVERSGLWHAFDNRVLIYIHKEQELDDVERLYPADHYVLIDDKLRILSAVKKIWGERVTTVFPKQGHYALDSNDTGRVSARGYRARQHRRSAQLRSSRVSYEGGQAAALAKLLADRAMLRAAPSRSHPILVSCRRLHCRSIVVNWVSPKSTTKMASSFAGSVVLAFSLMR